MSKYENVYCIVFMSVISEFQKTLFRHINTFLKRLNKLLCFVAVHLI